MSDRKPSPADTGKVGVVPPRIPAHQWRLLLPLALLLLAAGVYWLQRGHDSSEHALRLAVVHQSALAARLSASATRAVAGEAGGYLELRRIRTHAAAARTPLTFESSPLTQQKENDALRVKLDELKDLWRRVDGASERLLKAETATARVRKDVEAFLSIATGILVTADELVDAMVAADEPPAQVRAASRQLLLIQRISANIRRVPEGGEGVITAADRFGRDAVLFGEVNNALLVGSPEMKLKRVRNGRARELLVDVGREFRRSADLIEQIMSDAVALAGARTAAAVVVADTSRIAALSREIEVGLVAASASRVPLALLIQIFGALAILSLLIAIGHIAAVTRKARIQLRRHMAVVANESAGQAERENAIEARELAAESAVRRLVDELDRLSRGGTPSAPDIREEYLGNALAPLEVAVNAVRRRFGSLAQAAAKLSEAGDRFADVAMTARSIAEEQSYKVEQAAKATRIMAAQVESVSDHGRATAEMVKQSVESTMRASAAVETAGGQSEQTLVAAKSAAARIRQLNESTRQIQEIGRIVDELSEQCRMLALNVSIRASLAEQSGAVSASRFSDDVQKLATDARRALQRIDIVNQDVRAHAGQAADSIKQVMWAAENAAAQNRVALNEIKSVTGMADQLDSTQRGLSDTLEEHTMRMTQVVKATTSVHQVTSRARGEIRDCAKSAGRLSELAGLLGAGLKGYDQAKEIHGSVIELPATGSAPRTSASEDSEAGASKKAVGRDPA